MPNAPFDTFQLLINGENYPDNLVNPSIVKAPDEMSRTFDFRIMRIEQFFEAGNDIAVGSEVIIKGRSSYDQSLIRTLARGQVTEKVIPERGGAKWIEINGVDHTYNMTRCSFRRSIYSPTFTQELFLHFKDDGSGSGAPTQYTRKAEMRVKDGSDYYIPFEDMDHLPLHSIRRHKADERSVYMPFGTYEVQYLKKELVFKQAQVDEDDVTLALPVRYVAGTPDPPSSTNDGWEYRVVASFFKNPTYPTRNESEFTYENIMRDVLVGDPQTDEGGAGYPQSMLQFAYSYSKGSVILIRDRRDEGMRVSAVSGFDVTVSDGGPWAGKTTLTYRDTQGVDRSYTISGIAGDVITLTVAAEKLVEGMRVHGCDQAAVVVTLTGVGETVEHLVNYTDVEIAGDKYHIRELRDATTLVLVKADETDDFSGLAGSGTLTYFTLEYTGLQINRLPWTKDKGTIAEFHEYCQENYLAPINYELRHHPGTNKIMGRLKRQYRGTVQAIPVFAAGESEIFLDDVDGFYPLHTIAWKDATTGEVLMFEIVSVDYDAESITVTGDASDMLDDDWVYANCRSVYRHTGAEHAITMEVLNASMELISGANQAYPSINAATPVTVHAAPVDPTGKGTWVITGDPDHLYDGSPKTYWLLRWVATSAGALEGDPTYWGMDPIPWPLMTFDVGQDEYDSFVLQVGYPKDELIYPTQAPAPELPMFTVEGSVDNVNFSPLSSECVSREFNPAQPNTGTLKFECDLFSEFRYVRICCNAPFFFKLKENVFGTPTRVRDVPLANFQLFKKPSIVYSEQDETMSQEAGAPDDQITPLIGKKPRADVINRGGTISNIAALVLTIGAHDFEIGDTVTFYDVSADNPFADTTTVGAVGATTITVLATPGGLANGDMVGGARRWLRDPFDRWLDFYMPSTFNQIFQFTKPTAQVTDESAQNGWDGQQIVALRLYEELQAVRDGTGTALFDVEVEEGMQIFNSNMYAPEMVAGVSVHGFTMTCQTRNYNTDVERVSTGSD